MSKPRYRWYGAVKKQIMDGGWKDPKSFQDFIMQKAMYEAQADTLKLPNGDERIKAIEVVLIQKSKNYEGVAIELYASPPTIQRWITSFVNLVGKKAGY